MSEISLILPAYREAENLKKLLPRIRAAFENAGYDYEILVLDTQTPTGDGTPEVCRDMGARYVPREGGDSYGCAIRTGIRAAAKARIAVMDADGSHDPGDLIRMMINMDETGADIVIGSRYARGGHTDNPWILRCMSYILNCTYRLVFRLPVKDVSDSFRLYDGAKLKSLQLRSENFDLVEEILIVMRVHYPDLKVTEIPIHFMKRDQGKSKRDLLKFIVSYLSTMKWLLKVQHEAALSRGTKAGTDRG